MNESTEDEIEESLLNYPLIPLDEIDAEARLIAVRWVENYEPCGFDLPNKQKLASDIINYSQKRIAAFTAQLKKQEEEIYSQRKRIKEYEDALQKIQLMKRLPGEKDDYYAFNRCWHLATNALEITTK